MRAFPSGFSETLFSTSLPLGEWDVFDFAAGWVFDRGVLEAFIDILSLCPVSLRILRQCTPCSYCEWQSNSYEVPVNCCQQTYISMMKRKTWQENRELSSLGPRDQSFKKSTSSSSYSGYSVVHWFGRKNFQCENYRRNHPSNQILKLLKHVPLVVAWVRKIVPTGETRLDRAQGLPMVDNLRHMSNRGPRVHSKEDLNSALKYMDRFSPWRRSKPKWRMRGSS